MGKKERADILLVRRSIFPTREKAKAAIMEHRVWFEDKVVEKASSLVDEQSRIEVKEPPKYVSRGGFKLEKSLKDFGVGIKGKVVIDVGVSTGGFTDCLLKSGAKLVIAVDVGYGQTAWSLRNDARVCLLERTNIRYLAPDKTPELADLATVDVSFISVSKIINSLIELLKPKAELIILVKPQFEAGRQFVGKKGVIKDPEVHHKVLADLISDLEEKDLVVRGITFSPILGPQGNVEFFLYLEKGSARSKKQVSSELIDNVVTQAHLELRREQT